MLKYITIMISATIKIIALIKNNNNNNYINSAVVILISFLSFFLVAWLTGSFFWSGFLVVVKPLVSELLA